jgi:hypothetical protein
MDQTEPNPAELAKKALKRENQFQTIFEPVKSPVSCRRCCSV